MRRFLRSGLSALNQDLMAEAAFADEAVGGIEIGPQALAAFEVEFDPIDGISWQGPAIGRDRPCNSRRWPADGHLLDNAIFDEGDKILGKHFRIVTTKRWIPHEGGRFALHDVFILDGTSRLS